MGEFWVHSASAGLLQTNHAGDSVFVSQQVGSVQVFRWPDAPAMLVLKMLKELGGERFLKFLDS